jgi:hypothetical protein
MQATVNTCQAHAQQCTTIISRHSHLHTGTRHYRERTGVDMHIGHRSTDNSTPAAPAITLPTHPACKQLSIHAKHMHSNAQLSFLDTRTCIQALCTTGNVPGWTCTSAIAALTSAILLRLPSRRRCNLHASNCQYIHAQHMHSDAQLSFLDTRTCIQALCTTGNVPGWTCTSAIAALTTALLLRLPSRCRCILHASNCQYMLRTCTSMHNYHFLTLALAYRHSALQGTYREDMHVGHRGTDNRGSHVSATSLPTHPACKQLSGHATHMQRQSCHFERHALPR